MTLLLAVIVGALVTALSIVAVAIAIVRLPEGYFTSDRPPARLTLPNAMYRIARNLLGILLIVLGLVLSVPGVPGQGVLTMLLGVMLLDFPGRRRVERWLLTRPGVLATMNRLRRRFGAPPLREPVSTRPRH